MKRIHHIQQMGRNKIEHGDMIVRGRDEFSDDVQLARVVGNYGNRSRTLSYVALVDLPVAHDFDSVMESMMVDAAIADDHRNSIGIW